MTQANEEANRHAAASVIQKSFKKAKARRMFNMLTSRETLDRLKAMFLDDRAKQAGAEQNPLYSMGALAQRDALRSHPEVVEALNEAWRLVTSAVGFEGEGLSFHAYAVMNRKLYLACYSLEASANFSPGDFMSSLEEDWKYDSQDDGVLDEEDFMRSWFELVDVHVEAIDGRAYARWLRDITAQIIETSEESDEPQAAPLVRWRQDVQLLEEVRDSAGVTKSKFAPKRKAWQAAFPERHPRAEPPPPATSPDNAEAGPHMGSPQEAPPPQPPNSQNASQQVLRNAQTPRSRRRRGQTHDALLMSTPLEYGLVKGWPRLPVSRSAARRPSSASPAPSSLHPVRAPLLVAAVEGEEGEGGGGGGGGEELSGSAVARKIMCADDEQQDPEESQQPSEQPQDEETEQKPAWRRRQKWPDGQTATIDVSHADGSRPSQQQRRRLPQQQPPPPQPQQPQPPPPPPQQPQPPPPRQPLPRQPPPANMSQRSMSARAAAVPRRDDSDEFIGAGSRQSARSTTAAAVVISGRPQPPVQSRGYARAPVAGPGSARGPRPPPRALPPEAPHAFSSIVDARCRTRQRHTPAPGVKLPALQQQPPSASGGGGNGGNGGNGVDDVDDVDAWGNSSALTAPRSPLRQPERLWEAKRAAAAAAAAIAARRAAVLTSILGADGKLSSGTSATAVSEWARRSLHTASVWKQAPTARSMNDRARNASTAVPTTTLPSWRRRRPSSRVPGSD